MITKTDLCDSICRELTICKHLYTKLPEGSLDYRPTDGQRSTLELMRYLANMPVSYFQYMLDGDFAGLRARGSATADMPAARFPAAIDEQIARLRRAFDSISQDDFASRVAKMPWGEETSLEVGVIRSLLPFVAAYKLQLFLYAKACGAIEIGTANAWAGMDMPRPS